MLTHADIASLVPHQGEMCLLGQVTSWSAEDIHCVASSHLDPRNPLRSRGRLSMVCGCEYGFQAAALHGALMANGVCQPPGYLAALRLMHVEQDYLDDPALGELHVLATLHDAAAHGLIYGFSLISEAGVLLLQGRGTISLPAA